MQHWIPAEVMAGISSQADIKQQMHAHTWLQHKLHQSQYYSVEELEAEQTQALSLLLSHACQNIPFYRKRLGELGFQAGQKIDHDLLGTLPFTTKQDLRYWGKKLISRKYPRQHGDIHEGFTSGSSGVPAAFYKTELVGFYQKVLTLREHLWQRRDLSSSLAVIKRFKQSALPSGEMKATGWGPATRFLAPHAPCAGLDIFTDLEHQLDWVAAQSPAYLMTKPTNLHALVRLAAEQGRQLPSLQQLRTLGETLDEDTRVSCREVLGLEIADLYSTTELGYLAFQCEQGHYHVQSEHVLVEILDDQNQACSPGESGRLVVTTLNNYAAPLIRYELEDYAVVGEPCSCGRNLPVIQNILGRSRNMLRYPDGRQVFPNLGIRKFSRIIPVRQFQVIQAEPDCLEIKLVCDVRATAAQEAEITDLIQSRLNYPFKVRFSYHDIIRRSDNGKYEDFRCELKEGG